MGNLERIIFIFHSHKVIDQEAITSVNCLDEFNIKKLDLARDPISYSVLGELSIKMTDWEINLVDAKYMDHSIQDPLQEFLKLNTANKIKFLKNNRWPIGTPIAIHNDKAIRFNSTREVENWVRKMKENNVMHTEMIEY